MIDPPPLPPAETGPAPAELPPAAPVGQPLDTPASPEPASPLPPGDSLSPVLVRRTPPFGRLFVLGWLSWVLGKHTAALFLGTPPQLLLGAVFALIWLGLFSAFWLSAVACAAHHRLGLRVDATGIALREPEHFGVGETLFPWTEILGLKAVDDAFLILTRRGLVPIPLQAYPADRARLTAWLIAVESRRFSTRASETAAAVPPEPEPPVAALPPPAPAAIPFHRWLTPDGLPLQAISLCAALTAGLWLGFGIFFALRDLPWQRGPDPFPVFFRWGLVPCLLTLLAGKLLAGGVRWALEAVHRFSLCPLTQPAASQPESALPQTDSVPEARSPAEFPFHGGFYLLDHALTTITRLFNTQALWLLGPLVLAAFAYPFTARYLTPLVASYFAGVFCTALVGALTIRGEQRTSPARQERHSADPCPPPGETGSDQDDS